MAEETSSRVSFPQEEEKILKRWEEINAFETSIRKSEGRPAFTFYDGPPFATGMPHYGHILAGTIKDTVTRYAHQTGHYVERKWGWDCHGLPVEYEVEQALKLSGRDGILAMGIANFNAECRGIVMRYSTAWERVVKRLARWIDMKNDYRTMDPNFMESVWNVFRQLFDKGLVYRGFKVMPYSTACGTCLSNFEANLNYKDAADPSVFVSFPIVGEEEVSLMAWTTTPWTLPSNLALCVNPTFDYTRFKDNESGRVYIVAACRLPSLYKTPELYTVISTCKGTDLEGTKYLPIFPYFADRAAGGAFRVVCDGYVTEEGGTGVVHQAPAFGEDDLRVCLKAGIVAKGEQPLCPIDANGRFLNTVADFSGQYIKDADKAIIANMKSRARLFQSGTITHSYPFCWRSDTPLIYRVIPSWFVNVEKIRDRILACNAQTRWVPEFVQTRRFHNWLEDARDWAVSRDRFWGTPLPVWVSDDYEEIVCVGSVAELEQLSGVKVADLHRESIDHITIPSKQGKGDLKRVEQVFDCWFESGSMPYAQQHYPFENKDKFEAGFPADFIAEGLDQTRGWFYTLMVLSTALFDKPAFKNVIVNGLVLAEDGKKMSKRLKNYPDPEEVIARHGADAVRLYLVSSPAVRAEPLKFREAGVQQVVKDVFLPWHNATLFFQQTVAKYEKTHGTRFVSCGVEGFVRSSNVMDQWIQASLSGLLAFVRVEMAGYRLYTVIPRLIRFIDNLTKWYVRLNRPRLKGKESAEDTLVALSTLYEVLLCLAIAMAPFSPFFADMQYLQLRELLPADQREECVHYCLIREPVAAALDPRMEEKVERMQAVIDRGRVVRDRKTLPLKQALDGVTVVHSDPQYLKDVEDLSGYIRDELNLMRVSCEHDDGSRVRLTAKPEMSVIGKKFGKNSKQVTADLKNLTDDQLRAFLRDGVVACGSVTLSTEEVKVARELVAPLGEGMVCEAWDDAFAIFDCRVTPTLQDIGAVRGLGSRVQKMRKEAGLKPEDHVELFIDRADVAVWTVLKEREAQLLETMRVPPVSLALLPQDAHEILRVEYPTRFACGEANLVLVITRGQIHLDTSAPEFQGKGDAFAVAARALDPKFATGALSRGELVLNVDGVAVPLVEGKNAFASVHALSSKAV